MPAKRPILVWDQDGKPGATLLGVFKGLGEYNCMSVHSELDSLQRTCDDYDRSCHRKPIILFLAFHPNWQSDLEKMRQDPLLTFQQVIVLGPGMSQEELAELSYLRISNYILSSTDPERLEAIANVLNNFWDICTLG